MTQGRKACLNPCARKGRYLEPHSGVVYRFRHKVYPSGACECATAWLKMADRDNTRLQYALDPTAPARAPLQAFSSEKAMPPGLIPLVPCQERYRREDSPGLAHHHAQYPRSRFQGCQKLEEELYEKKLVSLITSERSPRKFQQFLLSHGYALLALQDGTEFLVSLSPEEFALLAESRDERTETSRGFWKKLGLTEKQRQAVEDIFLYNTGETLREIADRYDISLDSLKDRIEGVKKKLQSTYPETLKERKKQKRPPKPARTHELALPVFRVHPVSGERSVLQPEERRSLPKRFRTPIQDLSQKIEAWNRSRYFPTYNGTWTVDPMQDLRVGSTDLEKRQERNKPEKRENYDGELPFLGRKGGSDPALDRNPVLLGLRFEFQKTDLSEEWAVE